jgi:hypothetical protein
MSFFSNQNLQINGASVIGFDAIKKDEASLLVAQQGFQDVSTLSSFIELDPMRNMLLMESAWDKKVVKRTSFADSIYRDAVSSNAVLEVNGQDGGFRYKMAIETDNCMKTVEDTSSQAADGYVGADGTSFRIVLNKQLSPFTPISCDMAFGDVLIVDDQDVTFLGYGFEHWVKLVGSEEDRSKVYPASLLQNDVMYKEVANSYIAEYSERLAKVHMPGGTNYLECEFKLGSGQGVETWFTGKADSIKLLPGYTTADTDAYLKEIQMMGRDADSEVIAAISQVSNRTITTIANLLEMLAIKHFNEKFNTSLMFMVGSKISTSKGSLEFNEGLWRQMRRGKIVNYNKKGGAELPDLQTLRNYVHKYNNSRVEDTHLKMKAGSELYNNLERIIQQHAGTQMTALAPLMGTERRTEQRIVNGPLDELTVELVRFKSVVLPGVGKFEAIRDTTLDYISGTDVRRKGVNPGGKDFTTYSGIIWDVTDQMYSNNATLPEGTKAVGGETTARQNVYLVRPERSAVVWGRENGRYNSQKASDIIASSKTMHESYFMYGFGAMWLTDPSKFVMLELKERYGAIR